MRKDCRVDDKVDGADIAYLIENPQRTISVVGELGKEMPFETVIAFNRANLKRLIQYPSVSRTMLRKMLNSEHASQDFRAIVIGCLDKPKDHGMMFTRRKQVVSPTPMVSVLS